jgi:hypothetical protein
LEGIEILRCWIDQLESKAAADKHSQKR